MLLQRDFFTSPAVPIFPKAHTRLAIKDIIEMEIPFADIEVSAEKQVQFFVAVKKNGTELEKWPHRGCIMFEAPTENFEAIMWRV